MPASTGAAAKEESTTPISLRMPTGMLEQIKIAANTREMPYQSLMKPGWPRRSKRCRHSRIDRRYQRNQPIAGSVKSFLSIGGIALLGLGLPSTALARRSRGRLSSDRDSLQMIEQLHHVGAAGSRDCRSVRLTRFGILNDIPVFRRSSARLRPNWSIQRLLAPSLCI